MAVSSIVSLDEVSVIRQGQVLLDRISFSIMPGQQWAFAGPSGSGKTLLTLALTGEVQHAGEVVRREHLSMARIPQQHQFRNRSNMRDFYYQQRFQSQDADDAYTLGEVLQDALHAHPERASNYIERFHLGPLLDKPMIQLSNGEHKRAQLLQALVTQPDLLILDNPFVGLDVEGRVSLHQLLNQFVREGLQLILIAPVEELPDGITHILHLEHGRVVYHGTRDAFAAGGQAPVQENLLNPEWLQHIQAPDTSFRNAVVMKGVNIAYENRTILSDIHWQVEKGSRWLVSGPNGAGKSTLLSLVNADNPQAYAHEIYLFDQRRGRGESIWDIKKRTGFVSPELHLFFEQGLSALQVVASGLFDTIGLFRQLTPEQEALAAAWLRLLHLAPFQHHAFPRLSLGQQRMVLLVRALVKNPPLLILDEPCQGLDAAQTRYFNQLVDELCRHFGTTLIYVSHYAQQVPACINAYLELREGKRIR